MLVQLMMITILFLLFPHRKKARFKIACLEEIALEKLDKQKNIAESIKFYGNCDYPKYLKNLIS